MPLNVLATKLFVPPARANLVPRPRRLNRLQRGVQGKLTLISVPVGFGKTTLVSAWVAGCAQPAAWLSLDEGENDSSVLTSPQRPQDTRTSAPAGLSNHLPGLFRSRADPDAQITTSITTMW
jgi:hypothetical protein